MVVLPFSQVLARQTMKCPDDANGDALRRIEAAGDDLTHPRGIEFTVVFPVYPLLTSCTL